MCNNVDWATCIKRKIEMNGTQDKLAELKNVEFNIIKRRSQRGVFAGISGDTKRLLQDVRLTPQNSVCINGKRFKFRSDGGGGG